ncbi:hypothetical protein ACVWZ6_004265 [Bradyrhizobium sp. GM6.1]
MMETFAALAHGMAVAVQPMNLLYALIGVFLGTAVGVLPGIGPALTVALLLPVTYKLDPGGSLIMFAGIYYGGMYGGSTTAILINTPGESASMATALEGNKMAKAGRGGPALATSAIGSFVAGTIATIGLAFLAPWLVDFAVRFGPEDYFALMCVAFVTVSATFGDSPIRGLTSLFIGLTLGLVGIDKLTGQAAACVRGARAARRRRGDDARGRPVRGGRGALRRIAPPPHRREARAGARLAVDDQGRLEAIVEAVVARHHVRLPNRCAACRRRGDPDFPVLFLREATDQIPRRIRQGRDRRCRRTGGRQQRFGCRHAGAALDVGIADLGDGRDDAGGLPAIRPQPGAAAVR